VTREVFLTILVNKLHL